MSDKTKSPISDLVEQAMQNYEQALRTALKLQEESAKCWTEFVSQGTPLPDWQQRWKEAASETLPILQKRMEESLHFIDRSSRTSLDLLKQALDVCGTEPAENAQAKVQELWEASLRVLRSNAQSVTQANAKVIDSWTQLFTPATAEAKPKGKSS